MAGTIVQDTFSLASKVAIVTGSGRENGIGAAIARALARNGAAVIIHYVSAGSLPRAQNVAQGIIDGGGRACIVQADITSPAGATQLVADTMQNFGVGNIDILGMWSHSAARTKHHSDPGRQSTTLASASRGIF